MYINLVRFYESLLFSMILTLKDVLSHSAHKQFIMTKTKVEIEHMRDVLMVLQMCDKVLDLYNRRGLTEPTGNDGHFKECCWADPNCTMGPDTCICCYVSFECQRIIEILDKFPKQ